MKRTFNLNNNTRDSKSRFGNTQRQVPLKQPRISLYNYFLKFGHPPRESVNNICLVFSISYTVTFNLRIKSQADSNHETLRRYGTVSFGIIFGISDVLLI